MKLNHAPRRLIVYSLLDSDAVADSYVPVVMQALRACADKLILIHADGSDASRCASAAAIADETLTVSAPCAAIAACRLVLGHLSQETLASFDELVFCSSNVMGPIHSFADAFNTMATGNADVWGMTHIYEGQDTERSSLQPDFLVFRHPFLQDAFLNVLQQLPHDATVPVLCETLRANGFRLDAFVATQDIAHLVDDPLLFFAPDLIAQRGCPVFLRSTFTQAYRRFIDVSLGDAPSALLNYLQSQTDYDCNLVWDTLLRTCHQWDLVTNLHLYHILPDMCPPAEPANNKANHPRICLVMHLFFLDLVAESFHAACSMPVGTDVYITTDTAKKAEQIRACFASSSRWGKLDVRVIENRGRDVSALLVGVKDVIMQYDLCCFAHDKKSGYKRPALIGRDYARYCFSHALHSEAYCQNIVTLFDQNPRLGMLTPPPVRYATWFTVPGNEWSVNFENTRALAEKLDLQVPMSPEKSPVAPLGSMFWFRPRALAPLYACDWNFEDFPQEPLDCDGTLHHAIERLHPFVVQHSGYYPAFVLPLSQAQDALASDLYYLQAFNRIAANFGFPANTHSGVIDVLQARLSTPQRRIKQLIKRFVPSRFITCMSHLRAKIAQHRTHV